MNVFIGVGFDKRRYIDCSDVPVKLILSYTISEFKIHDRNLNQQCVESTYERKPTLSVTAQNIEDDTLSTTTLYLGEPQLLKKTLCSDGYYKYEPADPRHKN